MRPDPSRASGRLALRAPHRPQDVGERGVERVAPRRVRVQVVDLAVARVSAARKAIDRAGGEVLLVARAECFLTGHPDPLDEALRRLRRFAAVGADVLYAPGPRKREEIEKIVAAVSPKPVNVLISAPIEFTTADFAAMGVRRISVGGALSRAAWGGFMRAAEELKAGRFDGLAGAARHAELDAFFVADRQKREMRA